MTFGKSAAVSGLQGMGASPAIRIAVPSWGRLVPVQKSQSTLVSREEILALFGDRLKTALSERLTDAEQAQKQDIVRLRRAIYS